MKKALLAVVLLVVLIAVSYFGATRSDERGKKEFQDGYDKGTKEASVFQKRADSLALALDRETRAHSDSVRNLTVAHTSEVDSLTKLIESKNQEIASLNQRKRTQSKTKAQASVRKADSLRGSLSHSQILTYYNKRLKDLPTDLSDYERKVAVAGIREETAKKFSITTDDLDKIRQNDNSSN